MNDRIKKLRKALDLTQQEFADKLGIKRNTVATYETGKSNPSDAAVVLICREFNVNEEWLRTGTGEMFKTVPNDILDTLIKQYSLPHEVRILIEKFLDLKPDAQQIVIDYVRQVSAALNTQDIPFHASPANIGQVQQESPPLSDTKAIWEKEADEFAEIARQQYLAEKKRESGILSVKKSGAG